MDRIFGERNINAISVDYDICFDSDNGVYVYDLG